MMCRAKNIAHFIQEIYLHLSLQSSLSLGFSCINGKETSDGPSPMANDKLYRHAFTNFAIAWTGSAFLTNRTKSNVARIKGAFPRIFGWWVAMAPRSRRRTTPTCEWKKLIVHFFKLYTCVTQLQCSLHV